MSVRRRLALLVIPVALTLAVGAASFLLPVEIRSSFDDLIGTSGRTVPSAIRARTATLVPIVVSAPTFAAAKTAADSLEASLRAPSAEGPAVTDDCTALRYREVDAAFERLLAFVRARRAGLVTDETAERLRTPEGRAAVARAAVRRLFASPVPPFLPLEEDPFGLAQGFLAAIPTSFSGWLPKDGVLAAEHAGAHHVLLLLELKREVTDDLDRLVAFRTRLDAALSRVPSATGLRISACGTPLHAAATGGRCKREIGWLTWFSFAFIVLLSAIVFRGIRWLPLLALSLAVAVLAALAVVIPLFGGFHLIALVFGTTVLGLVVDYSFHWLMRADGTRRETVRNLLLSCATTELGLLPLMLSSVGVLRQAAVFLGVGLAAALVFVLVAYPDGRPAAPGPVRSLPLGWATPLTVLVAALAACGLFTARFGTDLTALYRPPADLQAAERLLAEASGAFAETGGFVVTDAPTLETALAAEAAVAVPDRTPRLSRILPPLARRQTVAADVRKLYAEQGARQAAALGLPALAPPPEPVAWRTEEIPDDLCRTFLYSRPDGLSLVMTSVPAPSGTLPPGVAFCSPRALFAEVLTAWTDETRRRLGWSLALMVAALAVFCRRRTLAVVLPSALALLAVVGFLGLVGRRIDLFHLLAGFLLAGMSVDYTLFLHSGHALRPVVCSLLTSLAGFGALLFVSFPVVRSFGTVLGVGLPVAFLAALATRPRPETVEKAASPLGLEILFGLYRLFGLRVLHLAAACVGLAVWLSSRRVRRSSPRLARTLFFTRSLADKLVVMAEGRRLPVVETDGSADAAGFVADVRAGRGVFVLSSHCGTVEVLVALGDCRATFHAWMDVARTSVFNAFYLRHARRRRVVIHPISGIGMETAFFACDAIERGDSLVMAGDRGRGAFRFAQAIGAPTYFIACVATGPTRYRAIVRRLPAATAEMEAAYRKALAEVTAAYPDQWFEWQQGGETK